MKNGMIQIKGAYGAKIGSIQVFTYERAVEVYKDFCRTWKKERTMAASVVLTQVSDDMHRIGFTRDELEAFEIAVYAE